MRITVTQKDIERGLKFEPNRCPVARALRRALHHNVQVGPYSWQCLGEEHPLPEVARGFVTRFDADYEVKPFFFYVRRV